MLGLNIDLVLYELKKKLREFKIILDRFQKLDTKLLSQFDKSHLHGFIEKKDELHGNLTYLIDIANKVSEKIDRKPQEELINFLNVRIRYLVSLYSKEDEAKKVDLENKIQVYAEEIIELSKYFKDNLFKTSGLNGNKEKTISGSFLSRFRSRKITTRDNKNKDLDITAADVDRIIANVNRIVADVDRIVADVNRIAADVEQGLVKRGFDELDAKQKYLLRVKLSGFINSKFPPTGINVSTLCDAIEEYETSPEVNGGFLDTLSIDIKSVLKFYENKTNEDILEPRYAHPEVVLFEDNGYKLVKLVSEPHLEQQSKKLIKHEEYLFRRSDDTIVLIIKYDIVNGKIQQIKEVKDTLLKGDEEYYKAFLSFLKNLINKKNINKIEEDFVNIKLKDNEFLTQRGIVSVSELDERDFIIKGKLAVNDRNYEVFKKFLSYSGIIFDFTWLSDDRKGIIEEIKGSITDKSQGEVFSYKELKSIGGNLDVGSATSLKLGILQKVGGNLDAHSTTSLYLPSLEEVSGNLDAHSVTLLELEGLEEVGGNLDAHSATFSNLRNLQKVGGNLDVGSATSLKLEKLETVGSNLDARSATSHLSLLSLQEVGGKLDASSATILNLRILKKVGRDLDASSATSLDLERLEEVDRDLYALNVILLGLRNLQKVHKIFVLGKSRNAVKEAINPSLYKHLKKYKPHKKSRDYIIRLFSNRY